MENFSNKEIDLSALPNYEAVDFHPISSQYLKKVLVELGILLLIALAGIAGLFYYQLETYYIYSGIVIFVLFFGFKLWNNIKMQEEYGYVIRERDVLYKRGYLINRTTVVPFNRIQHATISRGILDKFFGIATLNIFTAGGSGSDIQIPGLEPELALRLKESLAKKISEDES
ncbi:PH domain-containing protein [Gillisia sp. Q332]|uniref:PH domain-containing protein n=1 Tax=Gillisia xinjiangensis TaxID=3384765 RepID=UPI003918E4CC